MRVGAVICANEATLVKHSFKSQLVNFIKCHGQNFTFNTNFEVSVPKYMVYAYCVPALCVLRSALMLTITKYQTSEKDF